MPGKRAESITNSLIIMCQLFENGATLSEVCNKIGRPSGTMRARRILLVKFGIEITTTRLPGRGYGTPVYTLSEPLEDAIEKIKKNHPQDEFCNKCGSKVLKGELQRKSYFPEGYCIPCSIEYLKIHGLVCTVCGRHLPWDEFGNSKHTKIGKNMQCKGCTNVENDSSGRDDGYGIESWFFLTTDRSNAYKDWCKPWTVK